MANTLREAVEADPLLHLPGVAFDYALPLSWTREFRARLDEEPVGIVWYYGPDSVWGDPYGVTPEGKDLLAAFQQSWQGDPHPRRTP